MDSLLQTLDLSLEVFLFLGVVFAHHGEASIIQLSGDIVLINADEQTVLLNLQNSKHSRCKLHSAIFAKSSLLANSINGVSKQCTAVPTSHYLPTAKRTWQAMLVFIHPCNLVGEIPQPPERFQRDRLRSCGAEHQSIFGK